MTGNCPNCGAPKHGSTCEYCGTALHDDSRDVVIDCSCDETVVKDWAENIVKVFKKTPDRYQVRY